MPPTDHTHLSRRERQIMDVLYELGEAAAAEIHARLPDPPSYSAVRAMLSRLEAKGHIEHREQGPRYLFQPTLERDVARETAMSRLVTTFFDGSVPRAVSGLLGMQHELSQQELDELAAAVEAARKAGR